MAVGIVAAGKKVVTSNHDCCNIVFRFCSCLEIFRRYRLRDDQPPMIKYESIYVSPWAASLEEEEDHKRCLARFVLLPSYDEQVFCGNLWQHFPGFFPRTNT